MASANREWESLVKNRKVVPLTSENSLKYGSLFGQQRPAAVSASPYQMRERILSCKPELLFQAGEDSALGTSKNDFNNICKIGRSLSFSHGCTIWNSGGKVNGASDITGASTTSSSCSMSMEDVFESADEGNLFEDAFVEPLPCQEEVNIERELLKEERAWLEAKRLDLTAMRKDVKRRKKIVSKDSEELGTLDRELAKLAGKCQTAEEQVKEIRHQIREKRKRIKRLRKYMSEVEEEKLQFKKQLQDAERSFKRSRAKATRLEEKLEHLEFKFNEIGITVKKDVDSRMKLYKEIDKLKQSLMEVQICDEEEAMEELCSDDPLFLIESKYPFFQDESKCSLDDISNVENPKKCVQAMKLFAKVVKENLHRFKHLPLGPLFESVQVKGQKWAPIVEYVLRPYLFSFLVDNIVDSLVMNELIEQCFPGYQPGTTTSKGVIVPRCHIFQFQNPHMIESRITAMSGLELENMLETIYYHEDTWGKFLSKMLNVEKILFMDNENVAFLVLSHIKNTPWHCKHAYTLDGFMVFPFPSFRTKEIHLYKKNVYLKCWPSLRAGELRSKIFHTKRKIEHINSEIAPKRMRQLEVADEIDKVRRKLNDARSSELHSQVVKEEAISVLNEPISIPKEKAQLKRLRLRLKKSKTILKNYETQHGELLKIHEAVTRNFAAEQNSLDLLINELVAAEQEFFMRREVFWEREDALERLEMSF